MKFVTNRPFADPDDREASYGARSSIRTHQDGQIYIEKINDQRHSAGLELADLRFAFLDGKLAGVNRGLSPSNRVQRGKMRSIVPRAYP